VRQKTEAASAGKITNRNSRRVGYVKKRNVNVRG